MKTLYGIKDLQPYAKTIINQDGTLELRIEFDEDIGLCFNINEDSLYEEFLEPVERKQNDIVDALLEYDKDIILCEDTAYKQSSKADYVISIISRFSINAMNIWNGVNYLECAGELKAGHLYINTIKADKIKAVEIRCNKLYCGKINATEIQCNGKPL